MVCDGVPHCPMGEDEKSCLHRYRIACPGMFKCRDSSDCIHVSQLCDGQSDCRVRGDDEIMCGPFECPKGCHCLGLGYNCSKVPLMNNVPDIHPKATSLIISRNKITMLVLISCSHLYVIDASHNQITNLVKGGFKHCNVMVMLDLSHNQYPLCSRNLILS